MRKIFKYLLVMILLISFPFASAMFTQPDPKIQNVYDPQSLDRYMFVRGNPYKYIDPTGLDYIPLRDSEKSPFTPQGVEVSNLIPHQAGIVYNEFGAAYYSQDVATDGSISDAIKIGLGVTVQGNPKYYEASSLEELYEILEREGELQRYDDIGNPIELTHTQDAKVLASFRKSYGMDTYNFYCDNCALRQSDALREANVPHIRSLYPTVHSYGTKGVEGVSGAISYGSAKYSQLRRQVESAWASVIAKWKANQKSSQKEGSSAN